MSEIKLAIRPFEMGTERESANNLPIAAAEAFAEWQSCVKGGYLTPIMMYRRARLADKIADVIQVACNLAARYDLDLHGAMEWCEHRNRELGRYPMEEKHAEPSGTCGSDDCNCGGDCGSMSAGMGVLRQKSPEEMSACELIETLKATFLLSSTCANTLGDDWCEGFDDCYECRKRMYSLLKTAYEREVGELGHERDELLRRQDRLDELERQVADLTHERNGLSRRLDELSDAGITELHSLMKEAVGDAKCIADAARFYVENARERRKPDPEREAVIERLRGYAVYMTEPPSENANRLLACITGNKDARIACVNDIEDVRDKLIELLSYEKVPDGE